MTNVYKHHHLISKGERVKIPAYDDILPRPEPEEDSGIADIQEEDESLAGDTASGDYPEVAEQESREAEKDTEAAKAKLPDKQELKMLYEQELKELADNMAQQAYFDALKQKKAELRDSIAGVQSLMDELVIGHRQFIEDYTNELKYMAIDIAEKMILEKISEDDLILQRLVLQTVNGVKNTEWLNVEISERLVGLVDTIKKELEKPEYNGRAFVFPVSGTDSVCRVVCNEGAIVSSIEVQAENLRKEFRNYDKQK